MTDANKKMWQIMAILIVVIMFLGVHSQYKEILICQKVLEHKINTLPTSAYEDTRSLEYRYFELLHKTHTKGIMEEYELKYYEHLKSFYKLPEEVKKPEVINDLLLFKDEILELPSLYDLPELPVMPSGKVMWSIEYTDGQLK